MNTMTPTRNSSNNKNNTNNNFNNNNNNNNSNFSEREIRRDSMLVAVRNLPSNIMRRLSDVLGGENVSKKKHRSMDSDSSPRTKTNRSLLDHSMNEASSELLLKHPHDNDDDDKQTAKEFRRLNSNVSSVTFNGSISSNGDVKNSSVHHTQMTNREPSSTTIPPIYRKRLSSISRMKHKATELKASLAFLIVAITYMFTWLPVVALTFDDVLGRSVLPQLLEVISLYAITMNALLDPFLYALLLPNFRKTLLIMYRRFKYE